MAKIVTIVGARPQFIKAAVVSRQIASIDNFEEIIIHTGQHFDPGMSDIFFEELKIPHPNYNLAIGGGTHGQNTGRMIEGIEGILKTEKPEWVLVYGDTDSTLAGALAAVKLNMKVAHVEAGLRSFNMRMPEEINRILTDRVSNILFCPTDTAVTNLSNEGFGNFRSKVIKTGDVMYDAALFYKERAKKPLHIEIENGFILCTIHRAENTDNQNRLLEIINGLKHISTSVPIIIPLHPRTLKMLHAFGVEFNNPGLYFIDPVGYLEMVWLLENSIAVLTDSGGLQKEAYFFSKPCITLRDETEWTELIDSGNNVLAGANSDKIIQSFNLIHSKNLSFPEIYGNGQSAEQIVRELCDF
jgi:UDP-GlcNAc3NAcA epimerase